MRSLAAVLLSSSFAACAGGAPPAEPTGPLDLSIEVDLARARQTIEDVAGGNFAHTFSRVETGLDPIGRLNFEELAPRHVRLRMALEDWEPANDDRDPERAAAGGFHDAGYNHGAFLLAQEAAARGVELTASIWDVPDWLVSNPGSDRKRKIPPALYPELAESIGEWLRVARAYGAEFRYVSFNEAEIGVNVSLTSSEHAQLVAAVSPRLEARGLRVRWLLGDCSHMVNCVDYARAIWEDERARPFLGPLAFHSWDADAPDASLSALFELGRSIGLPARVTEAGYDTRLYQRPEEFPTWRNALKLATAYVRTLKLTGASVLQYWQMLGRDYQLNDGVSRYPAFGVLRLLKEQLPAGSQVLETSGDRGVVHSLAARSGGDVTVVIVNGDLAEQRVAVVGLPGGSYRQLRSTAAGVGQEQPRVSGGAAVALSLPAESVTVLSTRR